MPVITTTPYRVDLSQQFTPYITTLDPRIWWNFEETSGTVATNVGNTAPSYNGTMVGQLVQDQQSVVPSEPANRSLFFPGDSSDDHVRNTSNSGFNVGNAITVMLPIQHANAETIGRIYARRDYTQTTHRQFSLQHNNGTYGVRWQIATTTSTSWQGYSMGMIDSSDGNPHLVAGIYDHTNDRMEVWCDGGFRMRFAGTYGNLRQPTSSRCVVGQGDGFSNNSLNGYIGDFLFWDRALTRLEMVNAYDAWLGIVDTTATYLKRVQDGNPLAHWRLGESSGIVAFDETTNNLDLTYNGTPVFSQPGAISGDANTAVDIAGGYPQALAPVPAPLFLLGDMSIEMWVKFNTLPGSGTTWTLLGLGGNGETEDTNYIYSVRIRNSGGNYEFTSFHENGTGTNNEAIQSIGSSAILTTGVWHHIVQVRDSTRKVIAHYFNGSQIGYEDGYSNHPTGGANSHFRIGATPSTGGSVANVVMDEVTIHDRKLSANEIVKRYLQGTGAL